MEGVKDQWSAGTMYETFMGRWSRQLAPQFVNWLHVPEGLHWLDVGCGTGALTGAICAHGSPASVVGCDPSSDFIDHARILIPDPRAVFMVAGVGNLPPRTEGYECIASSLALNFFPDATAAVNEMRSLTKAGGVIAACVWDYSKGMEFLRYFWDAALAIDQSAQRVDEGVRFPLCHPDALVHLFLQCGLSNVKCEPLEIATEFFSFDNYWEPMMGGTGPAPSYIASLSSDQRVSLAKKLQQTLPRDSDGSIRLRARSWAVQGVASS